MGPSRLWPRREPPTSPTVRRCSPLARLDDTKYSQPRADMGLSHAFPSLALPLQMGIALRTESGTDGPVAHPPSCAAVGSSRSTYACSGSWQRRDSSVHGHPSRDAAPGTVAWLLDCDDLSLRYFTLTLLGEPADGVAAAKTRHRIMTEGAVASSWRHGARRVIGANVSASTRQAHRHGLAAHHPRRTQRVWRRRAPAPCTRRHPCSQPRRATQ